MGLQRVIRSYIPDNRIRWVKVKKRGGRVISATPIGRNEMPVHHDPDTWKDTAQKILNATR